MKRIKQSEVKAYREQYWLENNKVCPVCEQPIELKDAVLDHKHSTGQLRNTIHRFCNTFISHIENNQKRNRITPQQLESILSNFTKYVESTRPILHYTFKTPEEKRARANKRAKQRRQAKKKL